MSPYLAGGVFAFYVLSCSACGYLGYKEASNADKAIQEAADLKASEHKSIVEEKAVTINNGVTDDFHSKETALNSLYTPAPVGLQQSPKPDMPSVAVISPGTKPCSCQRLSKQYKLSFQQCDIEELKLKEVKAAWIAQINNR